MKKFLVWAGGCLLFVLIVKFALLSQAETCRELEQQTRGVIAESQTCTGDDDCTAILLNCPFDCLTPVSRGALADVRSAVSSYQKSCMMVCPDCPKGLPTGVRCVSGRCEPAAGL